MPAVVQSANYIINAARGVWLLKLDSTEDNHLSADCQWRFDSVTAPKFKFVRPESASAAQEFVDIALADATIIQFVKETLKIDGLTGATISGSSASVGTAEASFTINGAPVIDYDPYPLDGTSEPEYATWSDFIADLAANLGADWLVIIPLGFTAAGWAARRSTGKVVAYAMLCGKLNVDIEIAAGAMAPVALPIGITSRKISDGDATKLATAVIPSIRCYEGKETGEHYTLAIPTSPDPLTSGTAADVLAGQAIVIAP